MNTNLTSDALGPPLMMFWIRIRIDIRFQTTLWLMDTRRIQSKKLHRASTHFLPNIAKHLSNKIHCDTPNTASTYMKQKIISSFEFQCIDGTAVHKIISDLSVKNNCGVDGVSSKLLKTISPVIAAPLAHIINQSLCTGIFPDRLKMAKVIPLYKKDHI